MKGVLSGNWASEFKKGFKKGVGSMKQGMKLKFKIQPYQTNAVEAVVDCFARQVNLTRCCGHA